MPLDLGSRASGIWGISTTCAGDAVARNGAYPAGTVRFTVNGKKAGSVKITVKNKGTITTKLARKYASSITVKVTYVGSPKASVTKSVSKKVSVKAK